MKSNTKYKILLSIRLSSIVLTPFITYKSIEYSNSQGLYADQQCFGEYIDDFKTNSFGRPLRLPLDENPIAVVIDAENDQTKQYIIDGINALDEISTNINYTIFDSKDFEFSRNVNYINIKMVDEITNTKSGDTAGIASYTYNNNTALIDYPINIQIEKYFAEGYWDLYQTKSVLTTIVQHELMHTLGFKDLYKPEDITRSIMYYQVGIGTPITFTQEDINKIQYCYDGKTIAQTTQPSEIEISNKTPIYKEENDELTF